MAPLHFTEPHPSVTSNKSRVLGTGRGGAGNYKSYSPAELTSGPSATGPAARASISSTTSTSSAASTKSTSKPAKYMTGIGGAGNATSERRLFSFDEELERQQRLADAASASPVYSVGRGGAGNTFSQRDVAKGKGKADGASVSSAGSEMSGKAKRGVEGLKGRVARVFARE